VRTHGGRRSARRCPSFVKTGWILVCLTALRAGRAHGQVLACQALYGERAVTTEFFQKSAEVSRLLLQRAGGELLEVNELVSQGDLAEMQGRAAPELFRLALARLQTLADSLAAVETGLKELADIHSQDRLLSVYEDTLAKILRDFSARGRARLRGLRHSNVGGREEASQSLTDLRGILAAQRTDLAVVRRQLGETIEALRMALPAGEKGRFMAAMFAGRSRFFAKWQQSVELFETYRRFYVDSCDCTLAAVAQVYPAGLQWLEEPGTATERKGSKGVGP